MLNINKIPIKVYPHLLANLEEKSGCCLTSTRGKIFKKKPMLFVLLVGFEASCQKIVGTTQWQL
jgi:hypothetical protein